MIRLKQLLRELDGGSSSSDNMGSYNSQSADDPFAARIVLAQAIRALADEIESVSQSPQFDPQKDSYDTESIQKFSATVDSFTKRITQLQALWKQKMGEIQGDQDRGFKVTEDAAPWRKVRVPVGEIEHQDDVNYTLRQFSAISGIRNVRMFATDFEEGDGVVEFETILDKSSLKQAILNAGIIL